MLIKIKTDAPHFETIMECLKLKFRSTANSKTAKKALEVFFEIEQENEILRAQNSSMSDEIDRLRELLDTYKSTSERTRKHFWGGN